VAAPTVPLSIERIADAARIEHALGRIERIRPPAHAGEPWRLQLRASPGRVEAQRIEAFLDPADGALLGVRGLKTLSLAPPHALRTLYEFHRNVLLGEPGSNVVGVAGLLLMTAAISGIATAWPRSRARWRKLLGVQWRANAARVCLDLHRSTGTLIGAVLLLATATGATLVWPNQVRDAVGRFSRVEPIPVLTFRSIAPGQELLGLDALAARAIAGHPGRRITEIHLTERGLNGVMFKLAAAGDLHARGDTIVWLDPVSGEPMAERSSRTRSAGEAFMHWLPPLHVGSAFGPPGAWLMFSAGLAPLLLLPSGLWVWWRKRGSERLAAGRRRSRAGGDNQRR
jgi:uncharacterized iron-regulated membrane protein